MRVWSHNANDVLQKRRAAGTMWSTNKKTHTAPSARRAPQAESETDNKEASNYPCDYEFSPRQEDISTMNILS